jgi:RNA polymerase sigma-70 factor, ECF subfamily
MAHSPPGDDPSSVMAAGVAGDMSLMWAEFAQRLRAFVARRVPPGIEPDDVVQEVFLRVMRHLPSLREADRLEAWLFQIARNTLHDAMRARQRRDSRTDALEIDVPAEAAAEAVRAAEAELAPCLTPMVARLGQPYRQAIELTSVHGLTQAEAARRAGVSVSGMKSRVQRARERLKTMLQRCCEIDVDRRRGVADFHLRESASCGTRGDASPSSSGCGVGACAPRCRPAVASGPDPGSS